MPHPKDTHFQLPSRVSAAVEVGELYPIFYEMAELATSLGSIGQIPVLPSQELTTKPPEPKVYFCGPDHNSIYCFRC